MLAKIVSRAAVARPLSRCAPIAGPAAAMATHNGTCKWFDSKKGFGFIKVDGEEGRDVFVHQTAIHAEGFRNLAEDEPVEFDIVERNGKEQADNVTGPNGDYVQGAPPPPRDDYNDYGYGRDRY